MRILAVESSCDEMSWAIVEDGKRVVACEVFSQIETHEKTGGVVPEVAAREHVIQAIPTLRHVLKKKEWGEVDALAVTVGPGLLGSLLVGIETAKTLALLLQKPVIPVHHIEGHIYANWLERDRSEIEFPLVVLTVSGNHNDLYVMEKPGNFTLLGQSLDDAAGEAFDKVARLLDLGYPGGPAIEAFVQQQIQSPHMDPLPRAWGEKQSYTFSFSGLKSEVRRQVQRLEKEEILNEEIKHALAKEFQEAVVDVLSKKLLRAGKEYGAKSLVVTGGVSANTRLREVVKERSAKFGFSPSQIFFPVKKLYCTDNAAMIGAAAHMIAQYDPHRILSSASQIIELQPTLSFVLSS